MAAGTLTPQALQNLRYFTAQWGKLIARRAFGDAGPPLDADLLTLEQAAQAAAQGLLQGTLATLLEQQAQALPDLSTTLSCPTRTTLSGLPGRFGPLRRTCLPLPGLSPGFFPLCGPACA